MTKIAAKEKQEKYVCCIFFVVQTFTNVTNDIYTNSLIKTNF